MKTFVILLFLTLPRLLPAQSGGDVNLDDLSEILLSGQDDEAEAAESAAKAENYSQWLSHAIDLNKANGQHLQLLNILTDQQIANLLEHRKKFGKFVSIYELQTVAGFDASIIRRLMEYVVVNDPAVQIGKDMIRRIIEDGEHYVMVRYDHAFQTRKGFTSNAEEGGFTGSPGRVLWRIRSNKPGEFSFGITGEKDSGERVRWNPAHHQYGMDHYAVHAQVQNKGALKNLIAGDFQAQFGQGLIWGGNIGFGKGAETITGPRRPGIGFIPYTSAYESGNLRGLASTISVTRKVSVSALASVVRRDASVQDGDEQSVTSFQTTGLHRTTSELDKRKKVAEQLIGAMATYESKNLSTGLIFQRIAFDSPVIPSGLLYNYYTFRGDRNTNASVFLNYTWNNISFFSESAITVGGGSATTAGVLASLGPGFDLSMLFRHFARDYHPFYANAFSENTNPQNETGFYWGWKYRHSRKLQFNGYVDLFRFVGIKYRTYSPSAGSEWLARIQWQPSRNTSAFVQMRHESKSRNVSPAEGTLYEVETITKRNYWINFDYVPLPGLRMKTRYQFSWFCRGSARSKGNALIHDLTWSHGKVKCTVRHALFDTDDFDNRQYVYEHDVWLSYSLPAYYGKGLRQYALLQYNFNKTLTCWVRYSHTRYVNAATIGSGQDQIKGNQQNDIKFELRVRF